jgi:predicted nucleic acid-binding protein
LTLIDTSVLIEILRVRDSEQTDKFRREIERDVYFLTRFTQLELLQGARDRNDWKLLSDYLETQLFLEMAEESWTQAAALYFNLRRKGLTVRSTIDCCIAQLAIENDVLLLHRDRDFLTISQIAPLRQQWFGEGS